MIRARLRLAHAGLDVPATLLDEARRIDATP